MIAERTLPASPRLAAAIHPKDLRIVFILKILGRQRPLERK